MGLLHFQNCETEDEKVRLCALFIAKHFELTTEQITNTFSITNKVEQGETLNIPF